MPSSSTSLLEPPSAPRRRVQARRARRRLYPVTILYSAYSLVVLGLAVRSPQRVAAALYFAGGAAVWTLLEYLVHRHVLHGRFPDDDGVLPHLLHKYFDHLHVEHHARPWDGNHVNGTIRDTLPFASVLAAGSFLFPLHTLPVLVAGVLQSYVVEEWVHHSVHFCDFRGRYFQYIKRHHLYHHSPKGSEVGYGLTSGLWDVVWRTRIPAPDRRALFARRRRKPRPPFLSPPSEEAQHPHA